MDPEFQDQLNSALTEGEPPEAEPEATPTPEPEPEAKAEPARDESGQFAKAEEKTEPPKAEAPASTPEAQEKAPEAKRPPSGWTAQAKALFDTLPPEIQDEVIRNDDNFHKGISEYKQDRQLRQAMEQVVSPYLPMIQRSGKQPLQHISGLLQFQYELETNPQQTIANLVQHFGIDPSGISQQQQADPQVSNLQRELAQMKQMLQQGQQQTQQQTLTQAQSEIQSFANDPKNIYFENVRDDMALLLNSGRAKTLSDAYAQACNLNDGVRSAIQAQQLRSAEQKRIEEAKAKAANARKAGFDVSGSGAVNVKQEVPDSIEDHLRQAMQSS